MWEGSVVVLEKFNAKEDVVLVDFRYIYEGQFKDDHKDGDGMLEWPDGRTYTVGMLEWHTALLVADGIVGVRTYTVTVHDARTANSTVRT